MIHFHYGSGSPFGWRVWLALEHLGVDYELHTHSFSSGELKSPAYRAIHPRGRVPAIVDEGAGGFVLWESAAIVEYLDQAYGDAGALGKRLIPREARAAAVVRRMIREIDGDYVPANEELVETILYTQSDRDEARIQRARAKLLEELDLWSGRLATATESSPWLAGDLGAADHALYPLLALTLRIEKRHPPLDLAAHLPAPLVKWMRRFEALPAFAKTYPPHWK